MAEYIKSVPGDDGILRFEMDREGFEMFEQVISRSTAAPRDNQARFNAAKDRITGAFMAGSIVMGWRKK